MKLGYRLLAAGTACAFLISAANAGPHHHGPRHGRPGGWHWVAPAIAGGFVTYALIPPRVIYAQPPAYYPPPSSWGSLLHSQLCITTAIHQKTTTLMSGHAQRVGNCFLVVLLNSAI